MIVIQSSTCKQRTVRVESCTRDWRRTGMMKEARIRLVGREVRAVHIEGFDFVMVGTTSYELANQTWRAGRKAHQAI